MHSDDQTVRGIVVQMVWFAGRENDHVNVSIEMEDGDRTVIPLPLEYVRVAGIGVGTGLAINVSILDAQGEEEIQARIAERRARTRDALMGEW